MFVHGRNLIEAQIDSEKIVRHGREDERPNDVERSTAHRDPGLTEIFINRLSLQRADEAMESHCLEPSVCR
jgi:hypothetical protein